MSCSPCRHPNRLANVLSSQLKPTNVTSKGKLVFGQFGEQLDLALPARLVKHGFPYVYLKQQQRMVRPSSIPVFLLAETDML